MDNRFNKSTKVLYVIDTLETGGAEKSLVEITTNFSEVIPVFVHIYEGDHLKKRLEESGILVYSLGIKKKYGYNEAAEKLKKLIPDIRPDLIHATLFRSEYITRKLKSEFNIPLINSFVSNSYSRNRYDKLSLLRKLKLKFVEYQDKLGASRADLFISNSQTIKDDNAKILAVPKDKVEVIPRGRNMELFQVDQIDRSNLKKELDISDSTSILLNVGRLIESKGQKDLIQAFKAFKVKFPDSVLLIAGEGFYRQKLEELVDELDLNDSVKLLGNRSDIPQLHTISDLFVFPSYLEGMPGSLIEAMFSKTPILCSSIPENTEVITDSLGTIFEVGNIEDLERKLIFSFENQSAAKIKALKAYSIAIDKYEIKKVSRAYENLYRSILGNY